MLAIKLQTNSQNARVFLLLTLNKLFTKSENVAAKKLCGKAVALEILRKLTFWNVVGCKTEILMELGDLLEMFKESHLTIVSFLKLLIKENLLVSFQ